MAERNEGREGAAHHIHIEKKKKSTWLPWLLAALVLLALVLALSQCDNDETPAAETTAVVPDPAPSTQVVGTTPNAGSSTALAGVAGAAGVGSFLAGTEPAPRTFVFEKLNFDTASSEIRSADIAEVDQLAAAMKQYPSARISIAGYADARGASEANATLGKERADSIKAALVEQGIEQERIETTSGGESDPVDTNATASGRFENRRTELVVTAR